MHRRNGSGDGDEINKCGIGDWRRPHVGLVTLLRTVTAAANYIYKMTTRETGTDGQKDGALFPPVERE